MAKKFSNYEDLITFTRASTGHALRPVSYGTELVTNGTFDSDVSGWTETSASTSVSASGVEVTTTSTDKGGIVQSVSLTVGNTYVFSVDQSGANDAIVQIGSASFSGETYQNTAVDGSLYFSFVADFSTTYISLRVQNAASGQSCTFDNVSVKEVLFDQPNGTLTLFEHPDNFPRVEYDADRNRLGLLIEESRTNLFTYSEKLSEKVENMSTSDNAAIAPDGNQTASFCRPTTFSTEHYIDDSNVTSGTDYAMSCFAKQGPGDYLLAFRGSGIGSNPPRFNLETGTIDNTGSADWSNVKIEDVGNGWYRCSAVANPNNTTPLRFQITESGGTVAFAGDGTSGLYIWGCQIEQASFPTSYIKTTGSTATRSADYPIDISWDNFGYNKRAGTFVVEFDHTDPDNSDTNYLLSGGGSARFFYNNAGTSVWSVYDGAGMSVSGVPSDGTPLKISVAMSDAGTTVHLNGTLNSSSPSITPQDSISYNTLNIGGVSAVTALNGHIKSIKYYPRRLTNVQLQELTT